MKSCRLIAVLVLGFGAIAGFAMDPPAVEPEHGFEELREAFFCSFSQMGFDNLLQTLEASRKESMQAEILVFEELLQILTRPKHIASDVMAAFLDKDLPFLQDKGAFAFHGTQTTLDILESRKLKAYTAKCGRWAIFFGQGLSDAIAYGTGASAHFNDTGTLNSVGSVLVFKKDPAIKYKPSVRGSRSTVNEYLVTQDEHSLDNLVAILFATQNDAQRYAEYLAKSPDARKLYGAVKLYILDYNPLEVPKIHDDFINTLRNNWPIAINNASFIAYLSNCFPELFFSNKIAMNQLINKFNKMSVKNRARSLTNIVKHVEQGEVLDDLFKLITAEELVTSPYIAGSIFYNAIYAMNLEAVKIILDRIGDNEELMIRAVEILKTTSRKLRNMGESSNSNAQEASQFLEYLAQAFGEYPEALCIIKRA